MPTLKIDACAADSILVETAFLFPCEFRGKLNDLRVKTPAVLPNGTTLCLYVSSRPEGGLMIHDQAVLVPMLVVCCPGLLRTEIEDRLKEFTERFRVQTMPSKMDSHIFWIGADDAKTVADAIFGMMQFALAASYAVPAYAAGVGSVAKVKPKAERWFYLARYMETDNCPDFGKEKFGACTREGWSPRGIRLDQWYSCRASSMAEAKQKVERGEATLHKG